jgi:protein TonB
MEIPHHGPQPVDRRSRLVAGLLAAVVNAAIVALLWLYAFWTVQNQPTVENFATLLPDTSGTTGAQAPPPIVMHMIRPHALTVAVPIFAVASAGPPAQMSPPSMEATGTPVGGSQLGDTASGANSSMASQGISASISACSIPEWMHALHAHIAQYFFRPRYAIRFKVIGPTYLRYVINKHGHILTLDVEKSSGAWALDYFAKERMRAADPLPSIPDDMHADQLHGLVVIEFGPTSGLESTVGNC